MRDETAPGKQGTARRASFDPLGKLRAGRLRMPGLADRRARRSVAASRRRKGQELATARLGWDRACLAELDTIALLCAANLRRASPDLLNPQFRQDR